MVTTATRPPWMISARSMKFAGIVAAFIAVTAIVVSGITASADDAASRYFKSLQGDPATDAFMVILTSLGDVTTLFVFGIIITIIRRTRKAGMVFLIALVLLVVVIMYMKPLIGRPIPPYGFTPSAGYLEDFGLEKDSLSPIAADLSYPSGHAARSTALAFIVGYALYGRSRMAGYAIWVFPVVIGITRLYVMQHYPTDVIGGIIFGFLVSVVLGHVMKLDQPFALSRIKGKEDATAQS